jgi:hypothetical protein
MKNPTPNQIAGNHAKSSIRRSQRLCHARRTPVPVITLQQDQPAARSPDQPRYPRL